MAKHAKESAADKSAQEPLSNPVVLGAAQAGAKPAKKPTSKAALAFLGCAFVVMLIPSVGMLWARTDTTSENRTLAAEPQLFTNEGAFNLNILSDAGSYFEDHFAYRNELLSADSSLRAGLLGTSSTDSVVVGTEGWLYYAGSLPDYLGQSALSDRALRNIAHNLSLLQGYTQAQGSSFLFTVAPNKNSLYSEHMPYYYLRTNISSNWERLKPYLDDYGVNYLDLFSLFEGKDEVLYYKRDTHWTNKGALLAANALLEKLSREGVAASDDDWVEHENSYVGDISSMLYASNPVTEDDCVLVGVNDQDGLSGSNWTYAQGSAVTDNEVLTHSSSSDEASSEGSIVVYRDSFGNALIPYLSTVYKNAYYSKLVPYNALVVEENDADAVVVERAERHIAYLAEYAPIMAAPKVNLQTALPASDDDNASGTTLLLSMNGPYYVLQGTLDKRVSQEDVRIFVAIENADGAKSVYEAFTVSQNLDDQSVDSENDSTGTLVLNNGESTDYGFTAYVGSSSIDISTCKIQVFEVANGEMFGMKTFSDLSLE